MISSRTGLSALFSAIEIRGLYTLLGFRSTPGSQNVHFWPFASSLAASFNQPHTKPTPELLAKLGKKKPSILTVGARAITKHAARSKEGFWGQNKGSEVQKNE